MTIDDISIYRDRADEWARVAGRHWEAGRTQSAIAAAEEARDSLNHLLAAMRGVVRMRAVGLVS